MIEHQYDSKVFYYEHLFCARNNCKVINEKQFNHKNVGEIWSKYHRMWDSYFIFLQDLCSCTFVTLWFMGVIYDCDMECDTHMKLTQGQGLSATIRLHLGNDDKEQAWMSAVILAGIANGQWPWSRDFRHWEIDCALQMSYQIANTLSLMSNKHRSDWSIIFYSIWGPLLSLTLLLNTGVSCQNTHA